MRYYVGLGGDEPGRRVFCSKETPTADTFVEYGAVIGPFRTKRGAQFMAKHGYNNPHCRTVADAERLAKIFGCLPEDEDD